MHDPLIHIGYQRTGSTWLQKFLFPRSVGRFWPIEERKGNFIERLVRANALYFDAGAVRYHYDDLIREVMPGYVPLVSNERFCGSTLSGGYDTREIADRLKAVFPDARVLIGVREQTDMIRSSYNNYLIQGGSASLSEFLEPPITSYRMPVFSYDRFNYDATAGYYRQLFGENRVLVLPHETLRRDPAGYVSRLLSFCDLEPAPDLPFDTLVNVSLSSLVYPWLRRLNPFIRSAHINGYSSIAIPALRKPVIMSLRRLDSSAPEAWRKRANTKLKKRIAEHVGDRYADSNARLQTMAPVDLASLGYPVAPASS